jgi:hypothetical protein
VVAVSTFSWLDHRDEDQRRVREALSAFDQPGMVDPLGFGVVRDAFSEMLFPGISTVQTRARYFLLVPWAYRRLDVEKVRSRDGARRARELEVATIEALLRGSDSLEGIIGRNRRAATKQLPSFIYWGGLGRWGIRAYRGTRQEYVGSLDRRRPTMADGSEEPWPGLPPEPPGVFEETSLRLAADEAEFLVDRTVRATSGTYLELLVRDGAADQDGELPWLHPLLVDAPPKIARRLEHAELFAYATWGASLLYNAELSRLLEADGQAPLETDYEELIRTWLLEMSKRRTELGSWNRDEFWAEVATENPRALSTRAFVDWWLDLAIERPKRAVSSTEVRRELQRRESKVKGPRAKLATRRARERSPGAQGGELMVFRWPQVRRIVRDIHEGLTGA